MRTVVIVGVLLVAAASAAADKARGVRAKTELQEDTCNAWQLAYTHPYQRDVDQYHASLLKAAIGRGRTAGDLALDWSPDQVRTQQLCERYRDHFGEWPRDCCLIAEVMRGAVSPQAQAVGRAAREADWKKFYDSRPPAD